jgi:predicted glycosyltransferase
MTSVVIWVQHLLGIGHVQRTARIARAMMAAGLDVHVAFGGPPVPVVAFGSARLHYLPAILAADESFSRLLGPDGAPVDDALWAVRRQTLVELVQAIRPAAFITELFPFGRRAFRKEVLPAIAAAREAKAGCRILCSLRDILVAPKDSRRATEMVELFAVHYDHLLIHGDPAIVPLTDSLPQAAALAGRITYTGYITEVAPAGMAAGAGEVIVSAGNGRVGAHLMAAALAARPLTRLADRTWRILVGPGAETPPATPGFVIEAARPDFPALLASCAVSVSQAGYNTVMEILASRTRAVVVPFAAEGQTEQTLRAGRFAERGWLHMLAEEGLTPARLAAAIDDAWTAPRPEPYLQLDGAGATARLVRDWVSG